MKKFLFIIAFLCASVMGFAAPVEGSSTENMAGQGNAFVNGYDYSFSTDGTSVTISFTEKEDYTGLVAYLWNYTSGFAETGMTVSGHTASITLTGQTPGATLTFACKFAYAGGMSVTKQFTYTVEGTGGSTPDPTPAKASECFGSKGHFGNPSAKHVYYQIDYEDNKAIISLLSLTGNPLDFAEVQIVGVGSYAMTANGAGGYTYTFSNPTANAEWYIRFLYSDTSMPGNEMTAENFSSSDDNMIYYVVGACTATTTENTNIALSSAGASATASSGTAANAIDNSTGTRWESEHKVDPQWLCVNFGERKKFNTVQLVHEGAYIKTYDIQISDDGTNFTTIKHVSETLAGFPHEQTIELNFDYAAQYLRIYGTERGESNYGYSLYELRAMYSGASVLTSITLTAADTKTLIGGAGVALTATPKDQKGNAMEASVSYEITPAAAGHMSGNTYIPDQVGTASIRAYNGSIYSSAVQVLGVPSANLALSTNISTDNKIIAQSEFEPNGTNPFFAVDGNMGSVWQGSPTNGNVEDSRVYDCWFVVDLGAFYNISLVALHFEGACSELYHIDFSENNVDWNLGYNLVGAEGINARNDYWTALDNNTKVRYVRFWSTKSATGWGMKMYEFEVYGTEWASGDEEKPVMESASLVSSTATSAVIAVTATDNDEVARYHVVDDAHGIDANYTPSEGNIEITGLTHSTAYTFTITAKDASNNESANSKEVAVTTPFDSSINLALNKTSEAGYEDGNPSEVAGKANDGADNTAWVTYADRPASEEWWYVDLGEIYNLTNITALWGDDYSTNYILQARVEAPMAEDKANDAAWVTLATVTDAAADAEKSTNVSGVGRYVRFRSISRSDVCIRLREFRVYASGIAEMDTEAPVMTSASLVSKTDVQAVIAVAATDNNMVAQYRVTDAGNSIDAYCIAEAGNITVAGLTQGTHYTFTIKAVDLFGNESANSQSVEVTTTAHYTAPQAACPAPTWDASLVKAMYSPTYSADCGLGEWGSGTTVTNDTYGKKFTVGPNGAGGGYFGMVDFALNCLLMEKLHFDIWVEEDMSIRFVPIWGGGEQGITKNLVGQEWNSIDIDLTAYTGITNWGNITQMKLDEMQHNFNLWIANAYFYREAAYVDNVAPTNVSASVTAEGFYSVKISAQAEDNSGAVSFKVMSGEEILATGAAATGVATTITVNNLNPGTAYNFNVVAYDEANNAAAPVAVAATTKSVPASAPAPVTSGKVIVPVYSDALAGSKTGIQSGNWGETTVYEWLQIAPNDQVFYAQNFNYAGWHSWGASINATDMTYLHVDFYSTGMTQVSVTPISPGHEGAYAVALTANTWTSVDVPLSSYSGIDWSDIFQFKFMSPVGGNELMIDNVYFWSYGVTANAAQGTDAGGWATFAAPIKLAVPSGLTAYKASYEKTETEEILNLTSIAVIPANEGVILKGTAGQNYLFAPTDAADPDMSGNVLVGCPVRTDVSSVRASQDIFCMRYSGSYDMTGFFLYEGQYIPAGKAYLPLAKTGPSSAPRKIRFVINNEQAATDIEEVMGYGLPVTEKYIENGQLFIRRGEAVYTIEGVRVK